MSGNGVLVDNHTLQRRHQGTANDGHYQKGCAQVGVLGVNFLKGDAIDGGEHQRHEETDAYEAVKSYHANDGDGTQRTQGCTTAEDGQQLARIDVFHQEGRYKTAAQE